MFPSTILSQRSLQSQSRSFGSGLISFSSENDHKSSIHNIRDEKSEVKSKESSAYISEFEKSIQRSQLKPIQDLQECIAKIDQMKIFPKNNDSQYQPKSFSKRHQPINSLKQDPSYQQNNLQNVLHELHDDIQPIKVLQLENKNSIQSEKYDENQYRNGKEIPQIQQLQNIMNLNDLSLSTIVPPNQKIINHDQLTFQEKLELTKKMFGEQFIKNVKKYSQRMERIQKQKKDRQMVVELNRKLNLGIKIPRPPAKDQLRNSIYVNTNTNNNNNSKSKYDYQPQDQNSQEWQAEQQMHNKYPGLFVNQAQEDDQDYYNEDDTEGQLIDEYQELYINKNQNYYDYDDDDDYQNDYD